MKAVFFDIDGTLWDKNFFIPKSTKEAIKKLKENDILTFICSGRTRSFITAPELLDLGFDGIVAGCGTYIEEHGKVLFYKELTKEQITRAIAVFRSCHMPVVMEGMKNLYIDKEEFEDDGYAELLVSQMGDGLLTITGNEENWKVSKFSCALATEEYKKAVELLKDEYEILIHEGNAAEFVPKGHSKATGIAKVCELFQIKREDTYAFGDSANDLAMLSYAGKGICMGNGTKEAKAAADYVTSSLNEDGIYRGLEHFGLI